MDQVSDQAPAIREESAQRPATFRFIGEVGPLFEALTKAQSEFAELSRNADNPHFKNKYANLAEVLDAVRPALNKHGLLLLQPTDGFEVVTMVCLGASRIEVSFPLPSWDGAHELGSLLTYVRRYGIKSFFAVNDGEDDDGNASRGSGAGTQRRQTPPQSATRPVASNAPAVNPDAATKETIDKVVQLSKKVGHRGLAELEEFSKKAGCGPIKDQTEMNALRLVVALEKLQVQP